jgi:hypothetical protein
MRIKFDLWANPTVALQELSEVLLALVDSDSWTTLLLKGNWGVGKTSAVRSLMEVPVMQDKVKTFSYISLAGVASVTDEVTLFVKGLERVKNLGKKTKENIESAAAVLNVVLSAAGKGNITAELPGLLPIAAKSLMKDALVVIDELDRRAEGLALEEVLGLVIRLSEHRQCKVVVISNEDKFSEVDQGTLNEQREKVFDLEHAYEPAVKDTVAAIVKNPDDQARLLPSFERLGINNLRIVAKTQMSVDRFKKVLTAIARPSGDTRMSADASQRILENVVKISLLYWRGHNKLDSKNLVSHYSILIARSIAAARRSRGDNSKGFEEANPLMQELIDLEYEGCKADTLIVDYLRSGKINKGLLQEAFFSEQSELDARARARVIEELADSYHSNFSEISVNLLSEAERLIIEAISFLSVDQVHFIVMLLQGSKRVCDPIQAERRWAATWVGAESISENERESFLENLVDDEARNTLRQRFPAAKSNTKFNGFSTMLVRNKLNPELLTSGAYTDPDSLFEDLRKANHPGLIGKIKQYYVTLRKLDARPRRSHPATPRGAIDRSPACGGKCVSPNKRP